MGSSNALAVFRLYSGKIPRSALNVLLYMALVAKDSDTEPQWWEGHDTLAMNVFGRDEPVTRSDLRAVERAITPLFSAGAITTIRHASGHRHHVITVRYRLWLSHPAPDGKRRKQNGSSRRETVMLPTENGHAPDGKRSCTRRKTSG
jgi:hypothetical protein